MNILELKLPATRLAELKEFYAGKLGFEILHESNVALTIGIGNSKLTFTADANSADNYYHFALNIPENELHEAALWLKQYVTLLEYEDSPIIDFPNWNAHSVYFYDTMGNIVEFIARHNLNNSASQKFSAKSIINISEAGMPVTSVKGIYENVHNTFGAELWWGNLETFAAIGDENGLFIAVTTRRNWFPTDKPSSAFPFTVIIEGAEDKNISFEGYKISSVKL